jgi:hypothetical protein
MGASRAYIVLRETSVLAFVGILVTGRLLINTGRKWVCKQGSTISNRYGHYRLYWRVGLLSVCGMSHGSLVTRECKEEVHEEILEMAMTLTLQRRGKL